MTTTRWRIARLIDRLPGQCWTDLVRWVTYGRRGPWSPQTDTCRTDAARNGRCLCGRLTTDSPERTP